MKRYEENEKILILDKSSIRCGVTDRICQSYSILYTERPVSLPFMDGKHGSSETGESNFFSKFRYFAGSLCDEKLNLSERASSPTCKPLGQRRGTNAPAEWQGDQVNDPICIFPGPP
jgi:hypothetical protein